MNLIEAVRLALTRFGEISLEFEHEGARWLIGISKQGSKYITHREIAGDLTEMKDLTREDAISTLEGFYGAILIPMEHLIGPILIEESFWEAPNLNQLLTK